MTLSASMNLGIVGVGSPVSQLVTRTGSRTVDVEEAIASDAADLQIGFACDVTATKLLYMESSVALTIETNSSSAPQETIVLAANAPLVWIPGAAGQAAPFAGDVTTIYVTNDSDPAVAGTLKIKMLDDVTP